MTTRGQPWVPVEGLLGQALGLVHPAMVRRWLASGKGFMRKIHPPVVRLTCAHAEACFIRKWDARHVRIGTDPGSETTGIAVIVDSKVVWCAEITHRSSAIRKALVTRSGARSGRRCRRKKRPQEGMPNGRPRKEARWKHRCRPPGWLPPSVYHRVQSTLRWLEHIMRYACCGTTSAVVAVEICAFDAHKVLHPDVAGTDYQKGPLFKTNLKGFVFARDGRKCLYCASPHNLTLEHVVPESHEGSNAHWNRIAACATCNGSKGSTPLKTWLTHSKRENVRDRAQGTLAYVKKLASGKVKLNHLAATNVVAPAIANRLEASGVVVERTSGADTAAWRQIMNVNKEHWTDAACTAAQGITVKWTCGLPKLIEMTGRGRRLVVKRNASGFPRLKRDGTVVAGHRATPPHGFRAGDTVRINKDGFGVRQRTALLTTARWDGRCVAELGNGKRINLTASALTLIHHGCGAHIR